MTETRIMLKTLQASASQPMHNLESQETLKAARYTNLKASLSSASGSSDNGTDTGKYEQSKFVTSVVKTFSLLAPKRMNCDLEPGLNLKNSNNHVFKKMIESY